MAPGRWLKGGDARPPLRRQDHPGAIQPSTLFTLYLLCPGGNFGLFQFHSVWFGLDLQAQTVVTGEGGGSSQPDVVGGRWISLFGAHRCAQKRGGLEGTGALPVCFKPPRVTFYPVWFMPEGQLWFGSISLSLV